MSAYQSDNLMIYIDGASINEPTVPTVSLRDRVRIKPQAIRDIIAEFLGTMVLMIFGLGVNMQTYLSDNKYGGWLSSSLAWAAGVTFGVFVSMGVSGAHLNPAVTVAMVVHRRLRPWWKVFTYSIAQLLGAFVASAIVFGVYHDAIMHHGHGFDVAMHFATYPQPFVSNLTGFFDQVLGTALLVGIVFALIDQMNQPATHTKGLFPLCVGFAVFAIGSCFGSNCGYAINPARDLGPRLFTTIVPWWGKRCFTEHHYWFWIPIVAPIVGGLLGSFVYFLLIELHHPPPSNQGEYDELRD
eukprot:gnl/Trimastix_PCT/989.p2 GENE.gnl/Trimastix_PCT/989~~gnl/Trimastix_PCT/989.p2  ORF type:complete len:298 (+),score=57.65 gnl/Trimastix_PCT/989:100-993(+)